MRRPILGATKTIVRILPGAQGNKNYCEDRNGNYYRLKNCHASPHPLAYRQWSYLLRASQPLISR
jgi:hypothetical protein